MQITNKYFLLSELEHLDIKIAHRYVTAVTAKSNSTYSTCQHA